MTTPIISSDHPLSPAQRVRLAALADTIVPASADGRLPGAGSLDVVGHATAAAPEVLAVLAGIADAFDDGFADLDLEARIEAVQAFSDAQPEPFADLIFHVYSCYYANPGVQTAIGMSPGAPFPRGNSIDEGDLSLLDPVINSSRGYRRPPG